MNSILLLFLGLIATATCIQTQLRAEFLSTKLPSSSHLSATIYDGDDTIYLLGGVRQLGSTSVEILEFSISNETVKIAGRIPYPSRGGSAQWKPNGNTILFFGGTDYYTLVFEFDPSEGRSDYIADMETSVYYAPSFTHNNTVFLLAGDWYQDRILMFVPEILSTTESEKKLPMKTDPCTGVQIGNKAFLFGSTAWGGPENIITVDLETLESTVGPTNFPDMFFYPRSVYDGRGIWVIGGYSNYTSPENPPTSGMIWVDPDTLEWVHVPVEDFPVGGESYYRYAPDSVYVEKLDRIYFFGGLEGKSLDYIYHDEIFYIDLSDYYSSK